MRTCLFFLLLSAFNATLSAQSATPRHEIGIQFSGVNFDGNNYFNAFYKKELKPDVWRRVRLLFGNVQVENQKQRSSTGFSAGLTWGREKRRPLADALTFYHGFELGFRTGFTAVDEEFNWFAAPSIGYAIGLQHEFTAQWAVNLEAVPYVGVYLSNIDEDYGTANFQANVSSQISLGIVRRW